MPYSNTPEGVDKKVLIELRDSMKLLTAETIKSGEESAKLSKIMLALTVVSTALALSQLKSLIEVFKWSLSFF